MKLKYGMIGGGIGSLIGAAHREAASATGRFELVCGCFSSDAATSQKTGQMLGLDTSRVYDNWETMLNTETDLDAIVIVTPNHLHVEPALRALSAGMHVIVDKPMAWSLDESIKLKDAVASTGLVLAVTYTYSGYRIVDQMRELMASGHIGRVTKILVEYLQGWMSENADPEFKRHASWRMDPARSGISCAAADIGVHAFHLAEHISGTRVTSLCSMLNSVVPGHRLDDDAMAMLRYENGASGTLIATQVATGEGNNLRIRIYGTDGNIEWSRSNPDVAIVKSPDMSEKYLFDGEIMESDPSSTIAKPQTTVEAFATIYERVAEAIVLHKSGKRSEPDGSTFPNVEDGHRGMQFIDAMVRSSSNGSRWVQLKIMNHR